MGVEASRRQLLLKRFVLNPIRAEPFEELPGTTLPVRDGLVEAPIVPVPKFHMLLVSKPKLPAITALFTAVFIELGS